MAKSNVTENGNARSNALEFEAIEQPKRQEQPALDPFDPESLRLRSIDSIGVRKVITTVSCAKPNKHQFVRVHPEESYRMETAIFQDKVMGENYLVSSQMRDELCLEIAPVSLFTAVTRHNDCFLWPIRLPSADGRSNHWHESALAAAKLAIQRWVRVTANMAAGRYDVFEANGTLPDPVWPTESFSELLRRCFENRFIDSVDHPILKSLRGEV